MSLKQKDRQGFRLGDQREDDCVQELEEVICSQTVEGQEESRQWQTESLARPVKSFGFHPNVKGNHGQVLSGEPPECDLLGNLRAASISPCDHMLSEGPVKSVSLEQLSLCQLRSKWLSSLGLPQQDVSDYMHSFLYSI